MPSSVGFAGDPERWPLRRVLVEKAGWSADQIRELTEGHDSLGVVEVAMAMEEQYGIEIECKDDPLS
jgi:hypothetical protein